MSMSSNTNSDQGGFGAGLSDSNTSTPTKRAPRTPNEQSGGNDGNDGKRHSGNRDGDRNTDRRDGKRHADNDDGERRTGQRDGQRRADDGGKRGDGDRPKRERAAATSDHPAARNGDRSTNGRRSPSRETREQGRRRDEADLQPAPQQGDQPKRKRTSKRRKEREAADEKTRKRTAAETAHEAPVRSPRPGGAPSSFDHFGLGAKIDRGIEAAGYTSPRPIQAGSIAEIMDGRDILGLAQTGTGKTAAFVLPILHRLQTTKPAKQGRPRILIVSPTRELANQIHEEVLALGKFTGVSSMTIFGGVSMNKQQRGLRSKPDVLVACPGRLLDLYNQGAAQLDGIEVLVLDEADHMFDMGFLPDVRRILKALPKRRQNLLYSATMPKEIRHLTKEVLNDPHVVELNTHAPVETIEHSLYPVHPTRKGDLLRKLIDADDFKTAIVFTRTKHRAKSLAKKLDRDGHHAVALQGNMSQPQRDRAMKGFKDGTYDILVATDIAARGIDVAGVSHVINYDIPNTPEAYMHRIGRTGRAEREGQAFTFVTHEDNAQVKAIEKKLGTPIERVKLEGYHIGSKDGDDLKRGPRGPRGGGGGGGFRSKGPSRPKAGASRGNSKSGGNRKRATGSRRGR